ncbi:MAG: HAMP domain-containing sensor histidine kinase [Candidatus Edwardsbacteria bacterium]
MMKKKILLPNYRFLKGYLFLGAVILVVALLLYTQSLVRRLQEEPKTISRIFARFCATATIPTAQSENPETDIIFEEVIKRSNFPIVITDQKGIPRAWRRIGIDPNSIANEELERVNNLQEVPLHSPIAKILGIIKELDKTHPPIPMTIGKDSVVVGYVHYGESTIVRELRYVPFIQIGLVALFILFGFLGFRTIKANEERLIWVGLTKETAHQLGTPISSLLGWLALLKEKNPHPSSPFSKGRERGIIEKGGFSEVLTGMETDLLRLEKVASRFGKIGSPPSLIKEEPASILEEIADYFKKRLPRLGKEVEMKEKYSAKGFVLLDRELFGWAIENLLRNAIDAIGNRKGTIELLTTSSDKVYEILIKDNGQGIPPQEVKKIFQAGYTTKQVGWGLGLTLTKRIIEEYHGGRLKLLETKPGDGTTFQILLPLAI